MTDAEFLRSFHIAPPIEGFSVARDSVRNDAWPTDEENENLTACAMLQCQLDETLASVRNLRRDYQTQLLRTKEAEELAKAAASRASNQQARAEMWQARCEEYRRVVRWYWRAAAVTFSLVLAREAVSLWLGW